MIITVFVKPGKDESKLEKRYGYYYAWLRSEPVNDRANQELKELLEKHFNKRVSKIIGRKSRKKKVVLK